MARRKPSKVHGVLVVDKAAGPTSHDVVGMLRKRLGERRVGHSGTLDPPATGVLVCAVGNATRLLRFVTMQPKTYTADIVLGTETSTLDDTGEVTATHDMAGVTAADVEAAAAGLTGDILQVPPMVSAVKVDGRRLHELAREGREVDREPRPVTIHRFDVAATADPAVWRCEVTASSGTYVRTLAADLGAALGGGAHLRGLRRTAIGSFTEAEAGTVDDAPVLPIEAAVRDLPARTVDAEVADKVRHGGFLDLPGFTGDPPWAVLTETGTLLAVYEPHTGKAKPSVVIPL